MGKKKVKKNYILLVIIKINNRINMGKKKLVMTVDNDEKYDNNVLI